VAVPVPTESKGLQSRAELSQLKEEHTVDLFHHTPAHATAYGRQNDGGAPTASARRELSQDGGDELVALLSRGDFEGETTVPGNTLS
jgi:hypothetical protein